MSSRGKSIGTESRLVVVRGWRGGRGRLGSDAKQCGVSSWGNENVIKLAVNTIKH